MELAASFDQHGAEPDRLVVVTALDKLVVPYLCRVQRLGPELRPFDLQLIAQ